MNDSDNMKQKQIKKTKKINTYSQLIQTLTNKYKNQTITVKVMIELIRKVTQYHLEHMVRK